MNEKIEVLRKYFKNHPEIVMAFLFGSKAKGIDGAISDWDIAVYFNPKGHTTECEEVDRSYPLEDKVWDDVMDILKTDSVDLIVLNRAPANICASVLSEGVALAIKNRRIFINFLLPTMRQAEDYRNFVDRYYEISQRSSSLSSQDKEQLKRIINFLEELLELRGYFSKFTFDDYNNIHKRLEVERWIENIVNSSIDIGELILASQTKKIPNSYREVFIQLGLLPKFKIIDAEKLAGWVKLRNILAHEYLDIKWKRIEHFIKGSQKQIEIFIECAKKILGDE